MNFFSISSVVRKDGKTEIFPVFNVKATDDLLVRGKTFYAIWDEEKGLWSTNEFDVVRIVDDALMKKKEKLEKELGIPVSVRTLCNFSTKAWIEYKQYITLVPDSKVTLDNQLTFQNSKVVRSDYVSKRLPYSLKKGKCEAYDELIGTLYSPEERQKLEWAIGAVVSGDSRNIQKFIVLYGDAGSGKSTVLNIIQKLFDGYYAIFEAKALTSNNNSFSTAPFKSNPLVAIQHDGDLSRIEDNSKLNSIVSHELIRMNEKYKPEFVGRANCMLFMATNKPVKITDAKSGVIRRLIDVTPTGNKLPPSRYEYLVHRIDFELGMIARHCLDVYKELGPDYYNSYRPIDMQFKTDVFFNFVEDHYEIFKNEDPITLKRAYALYKQYHEDGGMDFRLPMYKFREELKNYYREFHDRGRIDKKIVGCYFTGFRADKFERDYILEKKEVDEESWLKLDQESSIFDEECGDCPAQYGDSNEKPFDKWENVTRVLSELDTKKLHYVRVPENHIVIDFDLKDEEGVKSQKRNLDAAKKFPPTYAEFSKGGSGLHLHYIYDGDVTKLSRIYSEDIEVKVFSGKSSLRRRLSKCNSLPIAHISTGLPLKEDNKVINMDSVKSERGLRNLLERNLRKEIHPGTKPSVDFIFKILEDAYTDGLKYDVTDMRPKILAFANGSTNHSQYCVGLVAKMHFRSDEPSEGGTQDPDDDRIVFFDVEVFPNLFLVSWKFQGDDRIVSMINPTSSEMEHLFRYKLVGFNNLRYDNHICYARWLGYSNEELYALSQKIIGGSRNAFFSEAYNLSYTDIYDFASAGNKKGLKKWEIKLGLHHLELGLPWDKPVPEEMWSEVAEYCKNDVISTEAVFNHLAGDWAARQILAKLSGLTVNHSTNQHSIKIIFGENKHPQSEFVYTDLSEMFPGYKFEAGKSTYRGEETGEGGYVYAEPGMYTNVALLDVASMHPSSIENLDLFGPYTKRFSDIKQARICIKHKDRDSIKNVLNGELLEFFDMAFRGEFSFGDLSNALKTVINSVYGLTSAKFENPFRDKRNVDNIVAKRGALFMIDLKHAVQENGFKVAHIKTDSIKIPDATPEIIQFVMDFGKQYGYTFEHEETYDRMCLVNNAVYIAKYKEPHIDKKTGKEIWWTATGAQFAHPYIFKTLFSHESLEFQDLCETKSVTGALYLDMNEELEDVSILEKRYSDLLKKKLDGYLDELSELEKKIKRGHDYQFVGKVGQFCPIVDGSGGGLLMRMKEGKYYAVTGTKGYRWMESERVVDLGLEEAIDMAYFRGLADEAISDISKYGDFNWFVGDGGEDECNPPWYMPCHDPHKTTCDLCSEKEQCQYSELPF